MSKFIDESAHPEMTRAVQDHILGAPAAGSNAQSALPSKKTMLDGMEDSDVFGGVSGNYRYNAPASEMRDGFGGNRWEGHKTP